MKVLGYIENLYCCMNVPSDAVCTAAVNPGGLPVLSSQLNKVATLCRESDFIRLPDSGSVVGIICTIEGRLWDDEAAVTIKAEVPTKLNKQ